MVEKLNFTELAEEAKKIEIVRETIEKQEEELVEKISKKIPFKKKFARPTIHYRINHILETLANFYNIILEDWGYFNCVLGENGKLADQGCFESNKIINDDFFVFALLGQKDDCYTDNDGDIISKIILNNGEYDPFVKDHCVGYNEICFPTRWLFEDFEEEIKKSKILYELSRVS